MENPTAGELASVVQALSQRRDELGDALLQIFGQELEPLGDDVRTMELLEASVAENVLMALNFIGHDTGTKALVAPTSALEQAKALAQRDIPVSVLIRAYRLGHARFLDLALGVLHDLDPDDSLAVATRLVQRAATFIDTVSEQVVVAYQDERDQWLRRDVWLRRQYVEDLLAGRETDLAAADRQLGYGLEARHVAMIAWLGDKVPDGDVAQVLESVRRLVDDAFGAKGRVLVVPRDEREFWIWLSPQRPADDLGTRLDEAGLDARIAVGSAGRGVRGFRASLDDALAVRAVMAASGHRALTFGEVAVPSLMSDDLPRLRRFVARTLRRLGDDDPKVEPLRETLRSYLQNHRSIAATAAALTLHRNSVRYRIDRAVELWGADLDDPAAAFRLTVALEAAHWLGTAADDIDA